MTLIKRNKYFNPLFKGLAALALVLVGTSQAFALPSFARQTGDSCDACHVGAFGPQLTPHGMKFKLGGYTDTDGNTAFRYVDPELHPHEQEPESPSRRRI